MRFPTALGNPSFFVNRIVGVVNELFSRRPRARLSSLIESSVGQTGAALFWFMEKIKIQIVFGLFPSRKAFPESYNIFIPHFVAVNQDDTFGSKSCPIFTRLSHVWCCGVCGIVWSVVLWCHVSLLFPLPRKSITIASPSLERMTRISCNQSLASQPCTEAPLSPLCSLHFDGYSNDALTRPSIGIAEKEKKPDAIYCFSF